MTTYSPRFFLDFDHQNTWYVLPVELRDEWLNSVEAEECPLPDKFMQYRLTGDFSSVSFELPIVA